MFYNLLKIAVRLALRLYCPRIYTEGIAALRQPGPLLIPSNHPNSFLDAIIIASFCRRKTSVLVRGDVFVNKGAAYFLRRLHCLPIYRRTEGRRLIERNAETFDECLEVFKKGENVLIFCEGVCENEWALRTLGKGTARLAFLGWGQEEINGGLKVVPAGLSYQNFNRVGKTVLLLTGDTLTKEMFDFRGDGSALNLFNESLRTRLHGLMLHLPRGTAAASALHRWMQQIRLSKKRKAGDALRVLQQRADSFSQTDRMELREQGRQQKIFFQQVTRGILFLVSSAGWLIHAPLYYPLKWLTTAKTKGTVFHDSVLFGLLFFTYPLYLILLAAILFLITRNYGCCIVFPAVPVLAFITVRHPPFRKDN